jgi:hypothetical protein
VIWCNLPGRTVGLDSDERVAFNLHAHRIWITAMP